MILDTFVSIFKADTDDLKKGHEEAAKSTDELVDSLKDAEGQAGRTTTSLASMAAKVAGFLAAGALVSTSLGKTIERAADIKALSQTSDTLGEAVGDVDAFSKAMVTMGGEAEGARDALTDMAESMGEALQDVESGRAEVFDKLGVSLRDVEGNTVGAIEGMKRVADAVEGMSENEAIFRIKELGITDNKSVELVLKGRKEIERMMAVQKEQGVVSQEAAERAVKFTNGLDRLKGAVSTAGDSFIDRLIPALSVGVEWMTTFVEWINKNQTFVVSFIGAVAGVVLAAYAPAMWAGAVATWAMLAPILAVVAPVLALAAAFALAVDDVKAFMDGNDSLIGQLFDKFPALQSFIMGTIDLFKEIWAIGVEAFGGIGDAIAPLADAFGEVFGSIMTLGKEWFGFIFNLGKEVAKILGFEMTGSFEGLLSVVQIVFSGMVEAIKFAAGIITSILGGISKTINAVSGGIKSVANFLGFGGDDIADSVNGANAQMNSAADNPLNATTSNAISNTNSRASETNVGVGQITINTQATDAQGIARDMRDPLQEQLKSLSAETATGVDR